MESIARLYHFKYVLLNHSGFEVDIRDFSRMIKDKESGDFLLKTAYGDLELVLNNGSYKFKNINPSKLTIHLSRIYLEFGEDVNKLL